MPEIKQRHNSVMVVSDLNTNEMMLNQGLISNNNLNERSERRGSVKRAMVQSSSRMVHPLVS
jgi:hypothetical protein